MVYTIHRNGDFGMVYYCFNHIIESSLVDWLTLGLILPNLVGIMITHKWRVTVLKIGISIVGLGTAYFPRCSFNPYYSILNSHEISHDIGISCCMG